MALDLRQLLSDIVRWEELVKDMPRLDSPRWKEPVVILKSFDCGRRLALEKEIAHL